MSCTCLQTATLHAAETGKEGFPSKLRLCLMKYVGCSTEVFNLKVNPPFLVCVAFFSVTSTGLVVSKCLQTKKKMKNKKQSAMNQSKH